MSDYATTAPQTAAMRSSRTARMVRGVCGLCLLAAVILSGCHDRDESEFDGDSDGIPVMVTVTFHEGVFAALQSQGAFTPVFVRERRTIREAVFVSPGYEVIRYRTVYEDHQPRIRAYLLAGDNPGDESLWYWYLNNPGTPIGPQTVTVPIRPGHRITLTLRAGGGMRGELMLGAVTPPAAPGQHINITMDRGGVRIAAAGAENAVPPPPPGSSAPPPPPPSAPPGGSTPPPPPPPTPQQ